MFYINRPAKGEKISSQVIRQNFNYLYNCLKTLDVTPTQPISKYVYIKGGILYYSNNNSEKLQIIKINDMLFEFDRGFKTIFNPDGTLSREEITHNGLSPFNINEVGYYREVLIILKNDGRFYFIEGRTSRDNISRPYDFCVYSNEIPIAIIKVQHSGEIGKPHQINPIEEYDILDVRPFISIPYERDFNLTQLNFNIDRINNRINRLEYNSIVNDYFMPVIDEYNLPEDKKIYIYPAKCYVDGRLIKFYGGVIDFTLPEFRPNFNYQGCYNSCLIYYDVIEDKINVIHGETEDCVVDYRNVQYPARVRDLNRNLYVDNTKIPIAVVIYRAFNDAQVTREIYPINSYTHCGNVRISHKYNIIDIDNDIIKVRIDNDVDISVFEQLFSVNSNNKNNIMIEDNSNICTRRIIAVIENNITERIKILKLDKKIQNIERYLSPKAIDLLYHREVIEDVRPHLSI